jgi:hypothetical protein
MNILTDVLSLIRRGKFAKVANPDDVLVLGVNEEPDMLGIASPIPYKSVKVIKIKDFKIAAKHCDHVNSPTTGAPSGLGEVYQKTVANQETGACSIFFRSLKSLSGNLTFATSADDDYVEITTTGEPNTAANVGTGTGVWKDKVGETLNFKSLTSADSSVTITQTADEIDLSATASVSGATGNFMSADGKAVTVVNGLITQIIAT